MAAPARIPLTPPTLASVDAALAAWRERLAAASRNVSELSELPEYLGAKAAAPGPGRLAAEARALTATVDELWQGVLLIGATLDRAEAARGASRLWRGDEAAAEATAILDGPSITIDLAETPVLHRGLLAGARATAAVTPAGLLAIMTASFDKARAQLTAIAGAETRATQLAAQLTSELAAIDPAITQDWPARLAAAAQTGDALDRIAALTALRPEIAATAAAATALAAAHRQLGQLGPAIAAATTAAAACRAAVTTPLPSLDPAAPAELAAWLARIAQTLAAGRTDAARIGLANWGALHDRTAAAAHALAERAAAALSRRDDLQARFRLLRAKSRAHPTQAAAAPDAAAAAALAATPIDLEAAAAALRAYGAALASEPAKD